METFLNNLTDLPQAARYEINKSIRRLFAARVAADYVAFAILEIVADAVRRDDDWWYVPVRLDAHVPHTWQYYDTLVEFEDEIARDERLKVLLVPSG